ncbi:ATP-binding cassette domain-containing protein [Caldiplasma sukawensis]
MTLIKISHLKYRVGGKNILTINNLEIKSPTVLAIIGPNGSGKSTFLKLISGIIETGEGSIDIFFEDGKSDFIQRKMRIGSLIENPPFYPYITPEQFIKFTIEMRNGKVMKNDSMISEILQTIGMSEKGDKKMGTFSTGELKRIGIGLAICASPYIILLDEPTENLDPLGKQMVADVISSIKGEKKDKIVILTSHDLEFAGKVCNEAIFLKKGEIVKRINIDKSKEYELKFESEEEVERFSKFNGVRKKGNSLLVKGEIEEIMGFANENSIKIKDIEKKDILQNMYFEIYKN